MNKETATRAGLIAAIGAGVASLAAFSIAGSLRQMVRGRRRAPEGHAGLKRVELRVGVLPERLRPMDGPVDHAALRKAMPVLDPPLSRAIIEEREADR